jgi:hypothetical protein
MHSYPRLWQKHHTGDSTGGLAGIPGAGNEEDEMATKQQLAASKSNVKKAAQAAKSKRTIANLPKSTRTALSKNAAAARQRGGQPGRRYEDRTREQLMEAAQKRGIAGRSKMGKTELIEALRKR